MARILLRMTSLRTAAACPYKEHNQFMNTRKVNYRRDFEKVCKWINSKEWDKGFKNQKTRCARPLLLSRNPKICWSKNLFFHWMIRNGKKFIEIIERKRENQQTNAINQFTSSANNQQATGHHSQDEKNLEKRKKCVEKDVRSRTRGKMGIRILRLAGIVESDGRGTRCSYRNNKTGARRGFRRHKKSDPSREFRVKNECSKELEQPKMQSFDARADLIDRQLR